MPAANAWCAEAELSIGQSKLPSYFSIQTIALIFGKSAGSWVVRRSVIHAAFDPPYSVDDVSPITIGLVGAIVPVIRLYVGPISVENDFQTSFFHVFVPQL